MSSPASCGALISTDRGDEAATTVTEEEPRLKCAGTYDPIRSFPPSKLPGSFPPLEVCHLEKKAAGCNHTHDPVGHIAIFARDLVLI